MGKKVFSTVLTVGFLFTVSGCNTGVNVTAADEQILLTDTVAAVAKVDENWLNSLGDIFDVDGEVVKKEYTAAGSVSSTSLDKGVLTVGGSVNTGEPHISLNYTENFGLPTWFYSNPEHKSLCCSCGLCSGADNGLTILEDAHQYVEHDGSLLSEEVMVAQVEKMLNSLISPPNNVTVEFHHEVSGEQVNKIDTTVVVDNVETNIVYTFFFNTEGKLYIATGKAYSLIKL